jgi:hypothetical protein
MTSERTDAPRIIDSDSAAEARVSLWTRFCCAPAAAGAAGCDSGGSCRVAVLKRDSLG